ncbi:MAG: sucrose phosphorylase [Woeseia sp.]
MQLITYADRLGGDLAGLRSLLNNEFRGLFTGVHILPFFHPIDGADAGFDPSDHTKVDPRLGDWGDIRALSATHSIMADMIVNHVSADSPEFEDVKARGEESPYWPLFLKKTDIYPDYPLDPEVANIYRPRPGPPFTTIKLDSGLEQEFWTTFSANQLDINVESTQGRAYLERILDTFAAAGVREIRLDAAGYAIKRRGTNCFMLPETFDFIGAVSESAAKRGIYSLVEIHSHYQTQIDIASRVGRVYDFALPPLVLHSIYTGNSDALKRWLAIAPRNCVTVLDTHDGIGIRDVGRFAGKPGLLADDQINALVETLHAKTNDESRQASGHAASNLDIYQVNATFYDALGQSDRDYLIARAIQFFAPGTPQVYYVGLLAGTNDMQLMQRTGVGRDINRHYYTIDEIREAVQKPVVKQLMKLMRLRKDLPVFDADFSVVDSPATTLVLRWEDVDGYAQLNVDFGERSASIDYSVAGVTGNLHIDDHSLADSATQ